MNLVLRYSVPLKRLSFPTFRRIPATLRVSGGTQRRSFPCYQKKKMKILDISLPRVEIEPTTCRV